MQREYISHNHNESTTRLIRNSNLKVNIISPASITSTSHTPINNITKTPTTKQNNKTPSTNLVSSLPLPSLQHQHKSQLETLLIKSVAPKSESEKMVGQMKEVDSCGCENIDESCNNEAHDLATPTGSLKTGHEKTMTKAPVTANRYFSVIENPEKVSTTDDMHFIYNRNSSRSSFKSVMSCATTTTATTTTTPLTSPPNICRTSPLQNKLRPRCGSRTSTESGNGVDSNSIHDEPKTEETRDISKTNKCVKNCTLPHEPRPASTINENVEPNISKSKSSSSSSLKKSRSRSRTFPGVPFINTSLKPTTTRPSYNSNDTYIHKTNNNIKLLPVDYQQQTPDDHDHGQYGRRAFSLESNSRPNIDNLACSRKKVVSLVRMRSVVMKGRLKGKGSLVGNCGGGMEFDDGGWSRIGECRVRNGLEFER
ncbi:hypothetical protein HDU76_002251 [Blyttiomyces sp. JEL0837]|nr:hypothetical protein HDU76_002251 [Blyttiomyces sp. JEL0837]